MMDANWTYSGDRSTAYANIRSLHFTPETTIMSIITSLKNIYKHICKEVSFCGCVFTIIVY